MINFNLGLLEQMQKNLTEPHAVKESPKEIRKIINFGDAKRQLLAKEIVHLQKLAAILSTRPSDNYEETICCYIKSLSNHPLSLKRLIRIIVYNPTISPVAGDVLRVLPYGSRTKIIDQIAKTWPLHQQLIKRLRHISYLVNFCERKSPEKSFFSLMPQNIVVPFILKGKIANLMEKEVE